MKKLLESLSRRQRQIIIGLTALIIATWGGFWLVASRPVSPPAAPIILQPAKTPADYFASLDLLAAAYIVYNAETGETLFAQNEHEPRSLASITKVMTALVLAETVDPQALVYIDNIDYGAGGNAGGLYPGEAWQVENLLALTLVGSSNYGAEALGRASLNLVGQMNDSAQALGFSSLVFNNVSGLDNGSAQGGTGSALDVARLFAHILKNQPRLLEPTRQVFVQETSLDHFDHTAVNTNKIVATIPGLLASKTGYTDRAGGNLAVAANLGLKRPTVFVVLGSTTEGRFADMKQLLAATLAYYADQ